MRDAEASPGAAMLATLAVVLLAAALLLPWFSYETSSGRRTAPEGFHDTDDLRAERHSLTYAAFAREGDVEPQDPAQVDERLDIVGYGALAGIAVLAVFLLAEAPGVRRRMPRWGSLGLCLLAMAVPSAVLAWTWLWMPASLAHLGITEPFTTFLDQGDGYTRTSLGWGWAAAALSVPISLGAFLLKFQAGADELTLPAEMQRGRRPAP